jgi:hypothetical protein
MATLKPTAGRPPARSPLAGLWGLLRGLLDRALLIAAVLAAGTVPSFVAQYRQRVGGMLTQVNIDLAPFVEIAHRFHGGSLEALIRHHERSPDPTFRAEGAAIAAMRNFAARLQEAWNALDTDFFGQLLYLARHGDPTVAHATWSAFQPAFGLTPEHLAFALAAGFAVWLVVALLWSGVARLFSPRR